MVARFHGELLQEIRRRLQWLAAQRCCGSERTNKLAILASDGLKMAQSQSRWVAHGFLRVERLGQRGRTFTTLEQGAEQHLDSGLAQFAGK